MSCPLLWAFRAAFSLFVRETAGKGHYEIERKFALTQRDMQIVDERLAECGFAYTGTSRMKDFFLPGAQEGEMMRIRKESLNDRPPQCVLTFKKWVKTSTGKERQESEREVPLAIASLWKLAGRVIGQCPLLAFEKTRRLYSGKLGDDQAIVSLDHVDGLGRFSGNYMEIEVIMPLDGDIASCRDRIFNLVSTIFGEPRDDVKQSYQQMLRQSIADAQTAGTEATNA